MPEFNTSLLREKFLIHDLMPGQGGAGSVTALSNRLVLPLKAGDGQVAETFVVRAQNMHSCVRMAASIAQEFEKRGTILLRANSINWLENYQAITKGYENKWNARRWVAVYCNGRPLFEAGEQERHPFLDIIEHCDVRNKGDYEKAMAMAQDAFSHAGRAVRVEYDSNIALVINIANEEARCGLILRGPNKTTTFNMTVRKKYEKPIPVSQCLSAVAAYLEGIQLAFLAGMANQKLRYELISPASPEARQAEDAIARINQLNTELEVFESLYGVNYRPERPNFSNLIRDAEAFARKVLANEIERQIQSGDTEKWVV